MHFRELKKEDKLQVEGIFDMYWSDDFRKRLQSRLDGYLTKDPDILKQHFTFVVAEKSGEILGIAACRKAPEYMQEFTGSVNPAELYVIATKKQGQGVGTQLRDVRIEALKNSGYTEMVLFSGESHKDAWGFYDNSMFQRVSKAVAPSGESGYIWRVEFD